MFYYFKKGENAKTNKQTKICAVYGEGAVINEMCQKWFAKFHAGAFLLDHAPKSGRLVEVIVIKSRQKLRTISVIPCRRYLTYSKYSNQALKIIYTILVMLIMLRFGFCRSYVKKNPWPYLCMPPLLKCNENVPFLKQIVTGDEK